MKKFLINITLIITLLIGIYPQGLIEVTASTVVNCDASIHTFSVDTLSYDETNKVINYASQACYLSNEYGNALTKFNELVSAGTQNVVIRFLSTSDTEFQSPLKIIRADRAMAYTQNFTYTVGDLTTADGSTYASTIGIYNDAALTSRYTYLDNKEPLFYYTTDLKNSSGSAVPSNMVAYAEVNGAKGYIKLTGIDIIPYIYVDNHVLVPFYVKLSANATKQLYVRSDGVTTGVYPAPPKYTVANGEISLAVDRATTLDSILTYTKAPTWLSTGTYYSPDGIRFYTDYTLTSPVLNGSTQGYFYNYYNYLSLRTKTTLTTDQFNTYLYNTLDITYKDGGANDSVMLNQAASFITSQETYGMNALLLYAMALQESAKGTSNIALTKLNIFSVNAVDSNTGLAYTFASIEDAVSRQMGIYLRYYMDTNSINFYGSNIGNKGSGFNTRYASDPFWSTKIAKYAYLIDKTYSLVDYNKYSLALLKPEVSSTLYTTRNLTTSLYSIPTRALNYPVTLTASYNSVYYAQSTSPIASGSLVTNATTGLIAYDWTNSMAYLNQNQVNLINTPTSALTIVTDTDELIVYTSRFEWSGDNLYIKGFSAFRNTNMASGQLTHKLKAISLTDPTITRVYDLTLVTPEFAINLLNGLDYTNAWFEGTIDATLLGSGNYRFEIITTVGDTTGTISLVNSDSSAPKPEPKNITTSNYRFLFNNGEKMRYELYIESGLNFTSNSYVYPTRFYPVAFFNEISILNQQLTLNGIAYIINNPTGSSNTVTHSLILVSNAGTQTSYTLTTSTGLYDYSNGGNDYTYAWFNGTVNLSTLNPDVYKMYILTTSNGLTDVIEIRNYTNAATYTLSENSKIFTINGNLALKKRMELTIQ